ncbi:MAG: iron ABC transporter permease [Hyphomicrobiales bacterium]|nr:iron ABC transporter permease [Hyphomicrobiales bacterium]
MSGRLPAREAPLAGEGRWLLRAGAALALLLCALPMLRLFTEPFRAGSAAILAELLRPAALRASFNTLETGLVSSAIAMLLGTAAALALAITDMRGKRVFAFLFAMSMLVAPQVIALAFKTLAGPASPVLGALGLAPAPGAPNPMLGRGGIILVLGLHHAPLVMLVMLAGLRTVPREIVEAARVDGARPGRILRGMRLPVLGGHLSAAWLLAFVAAIGNFGIPALLGLPVNYLTIPTLIYRRMTSFGPEAIGDAALFSLLLGLIAGAAMLVSGRILARQAVPIEFGRRLEPFWPIGRARPLVEVAAVLVIGIGFVLPVLSLLATALVPALGVPLRAETITLRAFEEVLLRQRVTLDALANSFLFAGIAALAIGLIALPLAYRLERRQGPLDAVLRFAIDLPYALPGVVVAIAMILLFLRPLPLLHVSLYGTAWIIILAYVARFLALGLKPVGAAMRQIDGAIEEAGALDGARFARRLGMLLLPAVLPALTAGMLLVFLTAFNELTVSALLWSAGTRTLGVVLFSLDEAGLANEAAALGIATLAVVLGLMLAIERLAALLPEGAIPWSIASARR